MAKLRHLYRNLTWGIRWGLAFGIAYSIWAGILYLVRGSRIFEKIGLTFPVVVAFYVAGGVFSGFLLGLLRPLLGRRIGAVLVGALIAVPVLAGTQVLLVGFHRPDLVEVLIVGGVGIFTGMLSGFLLYQVFSEP